MKLNTYLNFGGNCEQAFRFYEQHLGAYLSLTVNTAGEAERIYKLMSDGGEIFMPMAETFFAVRFGMLRELKSLDPDGPLTPRVEKR